MAVNMTTVAVSSMIGVLAGVLIHDSFGGRRSSIGVHRSNGRLVSFWPGFMLFSVVTVSIGLVASVIAAILTDAFSGIGALAFAAFGVSMLLNIESYSR